MAKRKSFSEIGKKQYPTLKADSNQNIFNKNEEKGITHSRLLKSKKPHKILTIINHRNVRNRNRFKSNTCLVVGSLLYST